MSAGRVAVTRATLVQRRVRGGGNAAESAALLAELIRAHNGDNLAYALSYWGFATERQAEEFAGVTR